MYFLLPDDNPNLIVHRHESFGSVRVIKGQGRVTIKPIRVRQGNYIYKN